MLIDKFVKIKWHGFTKQHYIDLGYKFTKLGDVFEVKVEDLPNGSHQKVKVQCDCCGKVYKKEYRTYLKSISYEDSLGNLCSECGEKRAINVLEKKYNGLGLASPVLKEKIQKTNIERYGFHAPMMNKDVYKKVRATQNERYGGIGFGSKKTGMKIAEKIKQEYGVEDNISQSEEIKQRKQETLLSNYGVRHVLQIPGMAQNVAKKARKTMYESGKIPCSNMEITIYEQLKHIYGEESCFHSYLVGALIFDILLVVGDSKIDVEYDGWYWHKNKQRADLKRNYKVLSLGYKVLRIKSLYDLPTNEQLIKAVDYLTKENHHYAEIILDIDRKNK